jgi:MraZ protein
LVFTGTYEHTIDSKNRLAIPAEVRAQIQREAGTGEGETVYLYVTLGEGRTLALYTERGFEQRARELDSSELDAEQLLAYERLLFSTSQRVELDKQGRVRLPEPLLKRTQLGGEVVLLGVKDHLEVRDRGSWLAYLDQMLSEGAAALMNPRRAMKRPPPSA